MASRYRSRRDGREDLFMELAEDSEGASGADAKSSRGERALSRSSYHGKRQSLPPEELLRSPERARPKSSGHLASNRTHAKPSFPKGLIANVDSYHSSRLSALAMRTLQDRSDVESISGRSTSRRVSTLLSQRSPMSATGSRAGENPPELPQYGRRRPSLGALSDTPPHSQHKRQIAPLPRIQDSTSDSPPDGSEHKQSEPESGSGVSNTAPSTVWDELDDLKSRIKQLELTGKMPATSNDAVQGQTAERPRTSTTAPTTIDSSPKHELKSDAAPPPVDHTVGGPAAANIHPLLHSALAKAKPLLNASLSRTLEATAGDALSLALMTGSAGPRGTNFSAASIINGATNSDRHVRRKADMMCRNLTDLCIALCEGRHQPAPVFVASPVGLEKTAGATPPGRHTRRSLGTDDRANGGPIRPMSRLESRRTSILGLGAQGGSSPRETTEDLSEQELSPSHPNAQQPARFSRAPSSLLRVRNSRLSDAGDVSADEDPTIRPGSHAITDFTQIRAQRLDRNPGGQQRSPSLRDSLAARRTNASAHARNGEKTRVVSRTMQESGRRYRDSTPPVLEEELSEEITVLAPPKRRIISLGQFSNGSRKNVASGRAGSLGQTRNGVVE